MDTVTRSVPGTFAESRISGPLRLSQLDVSDVLHSPGATRAFAMELDTADFGTPLARVEGPITVEGVAEGVLEGVVIAGRVSGQLREACRRCLEERSRAIEVEAAELFSQQSDLASDDEVYPVDGTTVDLDQYARDALAMVLPDAPLLCDVEPDACPNYRRLVDSGVLQTEADSIDPRWAPLKDLVTELEKEQ